MITKDERALEALLVLAFRVKPDITDHQMAEYLSEPPILSDEDFEAVMNWDIDKMMKDMGIEKGK